MGLRKFLRRRRAQPLWKKTRQDIWWPGGSIHADNTPQGTPMWARTIWDEIINIDPNAPDQYKPFWAVKTGAEIPMTDELIAEIKERIEKGYRVIFTNKKDSMSELSQDVDILVKAGAKPWGVSAWNEPDLVHGLSAAATETALAAYPAGLAAIRDAYDVNIAGPGLGTITNATEDYGAVYNTLFSGMDRMFSKVHSYGQAQPKYIEIFDLKGTVQTAQGLPSTAEVILEETANHFNAENTKYLNAGVADAQGAEFLFATALAGCQNKVATCHFMLYHGVGNKHFNDISDTVNGELRRIAARRFIDFIKTHKSPGRVSDLTLSDPLGREL